VPLPLDFSVLVKEEVKLDFRNEIALALYPISFIDYLSDMLSLNNSGIFVEFRYDKDRVTRNGIVFSKVYRDITGKQKVFHLSGSEIDPHFSFKELVWALENKDIVHMLVEPVERAVSYAWDGHPLRNTCEQQKFGRLQEILCHKQSKDEMIYHS